MLREYSRTKSESLAQIRATITELHHFFSKGLFFYWRTLYVRASMAAFRQLSTYIVPPRSNVREAGLNTHG